MVTTPTTGVKLDANAFRQAALAKGQVGAAIGGGVSDVFADMAFKIQQNLNAQQVFKADLTMRKTKDEFTANLAKMPDPTTWLPAWKQEVNQQKEAVLSNPHNGPEVKRHLNNMFDTWEQATTAEINTQALRKQVADSREDAIADSTYAAHQGDIEGAQHILGAAVENHSMSKADANKLGKRFPTIAAQAQADTAISTNPIQAPDLIKQFEKTMEPRMYIAVQARAREAQNQARATNLNQFAEDMDNSPDGTVDPKVIDSAVNDGQITVRGADGLKARMLKKGLDRAKDDFSVGMMTAQDHDWTEDKDREQTAREMKDDLSHLPTALRVRAYNHIDKLKTDAEKKGEKEEKPVQTDAFTRGKEDFKQGMFRPASKQDITEDVPATHFWSSPTKKVVGKEAKAAEPDNQWEHMVSAKERAATMISYAKWQDQMRGFFKQNPDATSEEAEKFSQQIMAPHVEAQVKQALNPKAPKPNTTKEAYESLKPGEKFWFDGRELTKQ